MKNLYIIALCFCELFSACNSTDIKKINKNSHIHDRNYETIANKITKEVAIKLEKEKGLRCIGTGGRMMNDIQRMGMSFQLFHEVDLIEARKILVYVIIEYLKLINENKNIRPYLHNYPFQPKNVEIRIWMQKPDGQDVPPDKLDYVSSINATLRYYLPDEPKIGTEKKLYEETYDEALKIVQDEELANQTKLPDQEI